MAQGKPGSILWPLALIVIGAGWLLHRLDVLPSVSWIIILGLITAGVAVLLLEGLNKSSIVLGPMLIAGGVTTFAQQYLQLARNVQVPLLLILCGLLMLLARSHKIPPAGIKPWQRSQRELLAERDAAQQQVRDVSPRE
ncbi:hypothetical protein [Chitinibacter tainanensis]|uniref:hypothetical protein n=1 Tax=Chitinibacter tainanensis TaxID=230667 RepID=UPI0004042159|nr:hypothetical protein [Chitinibacter tainanensis]